MSRLYDRHLAPVGVNVQQFSILSAIYENPGISIADLAGQMVMERTTLVRALKPLQEAELVEREPSGVGRSLALRISARGEEKLLNADRLWHNAQREFEKVFGKDRAVRLREEMKGSFTAV